MMHYRTSTKLRIQFQLIVHAILLLLHLQVEVPMIILHCLDHMEVKDIARLVAFIAKLSTQQPLAVQLVSKGLLDPTRAKRLLNSPCPREVTMDFLMIVSDLARMDKVT